MSTFIKTETTGADLRVGDRLDARGKHRLSTIVVRPDGRIFARVVTRGARSATVRTFGSTEPVLIYRPEGSK